jgi:hypothetical protein
MKKIVFLFALAVVPAFAVAATPPPPILTLANAVIAAANSANPAGFTGLFTNDAVVVDENPPFVWRGPDAGTAWWGVVAKVTQNAQLTHL